MPGDDAHCGDGDRLRGNRHPTRFGQNRDRRHHRVVVQQRLAHAHEDHSANRMRGIGLELNDLIHDFPRGQVATKTHPARGAKGAPHGAAHLGTHTGHILEVIRPVQERNADSLKLSSSSALKQILGEAVLRRDDFLRQRQMGNFRQAEQLLPQPGGKVASRSG